METCMEWQPKAEIIHVRSAAMIKLLRSKAQSVARRPRSPLKPKSHAPNSDPLLICATKQSKQLPTTLLPRFPQQAEATECTSKHRLSRVAHDELWKLITHSLPRSLCFFFFFFFLVKSWGLFRCKRTNVHTNVEADTLAVACKNTSHKHSEWDSKIGQVN